LYDRYNTGVIIREELGESDNIPVDNDEDLLEEEIEQGREVEDTVHKASKYTNVLAHNFY
jgi:hypothetical protein